MPKKFSIAELVRVVNLSFSLPFKFKAVNNFKIVMALSVFDVLLYCSEHWLFGIHIPDLTFELRIVLVNDVSVFFDVFLDNIVGNLDVDQILYQLHLSL